MAYTRYIILAGLAIVSYMLLLQWTGDYPPSQQEVVQQPEFTANDVPATPPSTATIGDLPSISPQNSAITDVPAAPGGRSASVVAALDTSTLISVSTDVFEIEIDTVGGDITFVSLTEYDKELDVPNDPFVLMENNTARSYIAQSGLIGKNGVDNEQGRASYQVSGDSFKMSENEDQLNVDLSLTDSNGVKVTKRYTFNRGSYLIEISYHIENPTSEPWQANLWGQIKRGDYNDPGNIGGAQVNTFLGFVTNHVDDPYREIKFDDIDDNEEDAKPFSRDGGWIAFSQHYFLSVWIPDPETSIGYDLRKNNNQYLASFISNNAFVVPANSSSTQKISFYTGPKDQYKLKEIAPDLQLVIDYSWLFLIAAPIYWWLTTINSVIGNFGVSIILLTVTVKAVFFYPSAISYKSMANTRRVMPKIQRLKESYGDDKAKLQKATMELYKKEKINPLGGCLPMLIQMPVFISLYWVLLESVELRHAPFMLWLTDLSYRDPYFILPLLMGVSMYAQQMLSPAPADPMQAKVMKFMPVVMTAVFIFFASGLVLYWLTNSILGTLQQYYITRKMDAEYAAKQS